MAEQQEFDILIQKGQSLIEKVGGIKRTYVKAILKAMPSKPIKIVTGFRRSGKSMIVRQVCQALIKKRQYKINNILYLNFEDIELEIFNNAKKLKELCGYFLMTVQAKSKCLLVFDEIQLVANWDKLIRTIYEFNDNCEIILTGSNSELLSSELGSNLAGRFIEFSIQSFSFKECLEYHRQLPKSKEEFVEQENRISRLFNDYCNFGGLPEVYSIHSEEAKISYLQGIISKVILGDVVQRFEIRNSLIIEKILTFLLVNIGNPISFARIEQYCDGLGFNIKLDTIVTYVSYLQKTFAVSELQKMDWRTRKIFASNKKYYAADVALGYIYNTTNDNFSKRLENIVLQKLKRDSFLSEFYYGHDKQEIDFIELNKAGHVLNKYQVIVELNDDNRDRELSSLINSDFYTQLGNNFLLSLKDSDQNLSLQEPGKLIQIKQRNLIKWLLDLE
jgi:predicted AAA+ superfamily ATPase